MLKELNFVKYSGILIFGILEGFIIFCGFPVLRPYLLEYVEAFPDISTKQRELAAVTLTIDYFNLFNKFFGTECQNRDPR